MSGALVVPGALARPFTAIPPTRTYRLETSGAAEHQVHERNTQRVFDQLTSDMKNLRSASNGALTAIDGGGP